MLLHQHPLLELELLHLLQVHLQVHLLLLLLLLHKRLPVLHRNLLQHRHGECARRVVRQRVDRGCTDW
jgi:hypothetical protein